MQAPSKGVWQSLGTKPLIGLAQGTFHRLVFNVPPAVQQALSAGATDESFSITLNVPSGGWDIDEAGGNYTDPDHHGFDILVGLTPELGGGAACGWLGVQVSGLFGFDLSLNRGQVIAVHETGHLFGTPHCDPRQGYVMCGAELHEHYIEDDLFVWHVDSLNAMQNLWQ